MPTNSVDRLSTSRTNLRELNLPPMPDFPEAAVTGNPEIRRQTIREWNRKVAEREQRVSERILDWLQITSNT